MSGPPDGLDAVVRELRAVRSTDPCAAIALTTIKATIHTLETRWCAPRPARPHEDGADTV